MTRPIRLNAFDMTCVGHQSPGLWAHPRDRSADYKDLDYWTGLARTLARPKLTLGIGLALFALSIWSTSLLPTGFIPPEDGAA